jgi:sterol desaturase/sphingolipid hydroxylase (fatty acid hydroxylase superfamily)
MSWPYSSIATQALLGYLSLASFMCLVLSAEIYWPRGAIISQQARMRAISFLLIYIPVSAAVAVGVGAGLRLVGLPAPFMLGALAAAIVGDFFYYWYHRAQHAIPILWKYHSVHHSVEELGAGTGYHHVIEAPMMALFVVIPSSLLFGQTSSYELLFALSIHGYYLHSTTRLNLGALAWIVADNRTHRIHHSRETRHFDKNFGAFTMIWDKLFGTAYFPQKDEWPSVGLDGQPEPKTIGEYLTSVRRGSPRTRPQTRPMWGIRQSG